MQSNKLIKFLVPGAFALVAFVLYCACSSPKQSDELPPCAITEPLDSLIAAVFGDCDNEPGGILEVMRNDTIIYRHTFGVEDMNSQRPITDSTIFNMSSTSKMISCVAVMKLVEDGRISLEDSLSKFFPEFHNEIFDRINVRHILTHTSGLPDLRPRSQDTWSEFLDDNNTMFAELRDFQLYGMEDQHMKVFSQLKTLEWEPGTHFQIFDPSLILLAPLVERVTGEKYPDWVRRNIFIPTGMKEAFYYRFGIAKPKSAHAYRAFDSALMDSDSYVSPDGRWQEYDFGEVPFFLTQSNRGLFTSARSYMAFLRQLYDGKVISMSAIEEMTRPLIDMNLPYARFGYGIGVHEQPGFPKKHYHLNANGGFAIIDGTWPSEDTHYVLFTNRDDWDMRGTCAKVDSIINANLFVKK